MLYHYLASDKNEHLIEGDVDAETVEQVLQSIASRDMRPISVTRIEGKKSGIRLFEGKITTEDKVFLTRYLSLMLRVGTDLLSAINILIADFEKPAIKNLLLEIRDNLSHGKPFYEAFAKHPNEFSMVFVNLVRAAETSGNLQATFEDLSASLAEEAELTAKIKSAFTYPVILLVAALVLFIFLSTFALPKIAKVFSESGVTPPTVSRIVFNTGLFVNDHIVLFLLTLVGGGAAFFYFFFKTFVGKQLRDRTLEHTPIIKNIYRDLAVQRFASTFSLLMKAGLPIVVALRITADVVGASDFKVALLRIADEGVSKGRSIGEAFKREIVFPRMVTNLIAISEKVGHLEQVLQTIAGFYTTNVANGVRTLISFLEPLLLMVMGLVVGGIALAIIVPIYQLTTNF